MTRNDAGHFDGSSESFRHWDEDGAVPGACSKCHSADGLPAFLAEGVSVSEPIANGLQCRTCHDTVPSYTLPAVTEVTFPSGAALAFSEDSTSNICLECHQGRQSTFSVRDAVGEAGPDTVVDGLGFVNVHYFASGATVFGTEAKGAYEYEGQTYAGELIHPSSYDECSECHDAHDLRVNAQECTDCHPRAADGEGLRAIRIAEPDFDGDGDADEGIAEEVSTIRDGLYAAIQSYTGEVVGTPIVYDSHAYPYFFVDTNGNGEADAEEANYGNRYLSWTPRLLKASYNYHYVAKDPGAYTHNPVYTLQILYDSVADLGDWAALDSDDLVRPRGQ
jgi:hypothetical protein